MRVSDVCTQMQQSQRAMNCGGSGMGRYVITERWSQRGIKMFQTNITSMLSAGVMHCTTTCACFARASERMRKGGKQKVLRQCVFGCVYLASGSSQSLWFQAVTVSRDCGSV